MSSPFTSSRSNAQRTAHWWVAADEVERRQAVVIADDRVAVDDA
jgi:hypothetical protein